MNPDEVMNEEEIDLEELQQSIEQAEDDIVQLTKAISLSKMMIELDEMEQFKTVFRDGFVKSYRDTAVVNIGLVRGEAQDGIKNGLIGRSQFEHYCDDLILAHDQMVAQLAHTEEELAKDKKLLAGE